MHQTKEAIKKICMLGDPAVGKTSLVKRYVQDIFEERYTITTGMKTMKRMVNAEIDHEKSVRLKLLIHDIVGQRGFDYIREKYLGGAEGALVVYDVTREDTVNSVAGWIETFREVAGKSEAVLVGNKADLVADEAQTRKKAVDAIAAKHGISHITASAKTGDGVEDAFRILARNMGKTLFD